jgi:methionyl-tRNA formyltransferase
MSRLRIIFAGSGAFGVPSLRALMDGGHNLVEVYTQPDRPAGRGRRLTPTPIAQFALQRNLPVVRTANINQEQMPPADLMVVMAFGQKIAESHVHHARLGSINLHASRLPRHRGAAPINAAILAGDRITGNSVIRLAQRMDAGVVLGQSTVEIGELETAGELHDRLADDGAELVPRVIAALADRTALETPQDESQATLAPKLARETSLIDWSAPAGQIALKIRGLHPWPGCRVKLVSAEGTEQARLTLVRARATLDGCSDRPGTITGPFVAAGGSLLEVVELQPEGKKPMTLAAYRNGHRWENGMRLESLQ